MVKFADVLKKQTNKTSITKHKQQQQQNTLSQIKKELKDILLVRPFRTYVYSIISSDRGRSLASHSRIFHPFLKSLEGYFIFQRFFTLLSICRCFESLLSLYIVLRHIASFSSSSVFCISHTSFFYPTACNNDPGLFAPGH